jgi:hypothetical protein
MVVPTDDQAVALKELLKGRKQGPSNVKRGKGTGCLPAEHRRGKGDTGGVFEA